MGRRAKNHMDFLCSFPRSGNHWVRFIIEWFSGRPSLGCQGNPDDIPIHKNELLHSFLSHVDSQSDPIIQKSHGEGLDKSGRLILIVRNFKECIARQETNVTESAIDNYMHLIGVYNEWQNERLLLYYEDLLTDPKSGAEKIVNFLGLNVGLLEAFMEEYNTFFEASVFNYDNVSHPNQVSSAWPTRYSATKGKKLIYHKDLIATEIWEQTDEYIRKSYPTLVRYVDRYFEKEETSPKELVDDKY